MCLNACARVPYGTLAVYQVSCCLGMRHVALRYALAQFVTNLALAAQFNCLETIGADERALAQLRAWAKEVRGACVLRAHACVHASMRPSMCLCRHTHP